MRFLDGILRFFAFKFKELELRYRTWKRAREISRAYKSDQKPAWLGKLFESRPPRKKIIREKQVKVKPVKPPKPVMAKPVKEPVRAKPEKVRVKTDSDRVRVAFPKISPRATILAAAGLVFAVGLVWALPHLSAFIGSRATAEERFVILDATYELSDTTENADHLEAAVMPEGYTDIVVPTVPEVPQVEQPPPATALRPHRRLAVNYFRNRMPRGFSEFFILVDKSIKTMYILRDEGSGWEIIRAYPVATGEVPGPKRVEGDKKTPQGEYFIVGRKHRSELTRIYGPAAFILDYPNPEDRDAGRTGYGIWIHGSELGDIPPHFTQGCVASSNPDIIDFAKTLRNWAGVPVVIISGEESPATHFASVDFRRIGARREAVVNHHTENETMFSELVMAWRDAWQSKDIETYTEFYSTATFANGQQRWDAYREHKLRTFAMYETINIEISDLTLTELTANSATVKFNQVYQTNLNRLVNAKRLIFRRERDGWKIHREIPFSQEELLL